MTPDYNLVLSMLLFLIGVTAVLTRRNLFFILLGVELMLNASNLAFVTFDGVWGRLDGQVYSFFVMALAASEACVGLSILVLFYRKRGSVDAADAKALGEGRS